MYQWISWIQDSKIMMGNTKKTPTTTTEKTKILKIMTMIFRKLMSYAHSFIRSKVLLKGFFQ